ncbi:MAG: DUF3473 domain-containing protein [Phycisphaerae bacterium]
MLSGSETSDSRPSLIFSVDVECWAQSTLNSDLPIGEHCADSTRRLLSIINEVPQATGTFFVLGKFAEKHPQVIRDLRAAGHEVACHGYGHVQLHLLTPESFRQDLRRAVGIISDLTGNAVNGYRAPVFSIGARSLWAFDVLHEEGFLYDSSIFPIAGRRYGIPNWPRQPRTVRLSNNATIHEFPLTAIRLAGCNIPISGGGYARLLPGWLLQRWLRAEAERWATWPVFYCHPYEIDPDEFDRESPPPPWGSARLPLKTRLHQGLGRKGFAAKLRMLLKGFRFRSLADALSIMGPFAEICAADFAHPQARKRRPTKRYDA